MKQHYLLTPGPTPLPPEVRRALAEPIIHHRTKEFRQIFSQVNQGLKYLFQTNSDVLTFAGSGTGAMEAAVVNLLSEGEQAIVVNGGKFGERWAELCQAYQISATVIDVEWGKTVKPQQIKQALAKNPQAKAVFTTLCETSTGVVSDIQQIGEIVKVSHAVLVVDAISGLGAEELLTDKWHVDCVVAGSQKGMMLPPGLSFCSLSAKALTQAQKSKLPKYYFDFIKAKKALDKSDTAFTPAVSLIVALQKALQLIEQEGLEKVLARHKLLARATRQAVVALGLKLFSSTFCNVVTAAYVPEGIDSTELVQLMRTKYAVSIANGQAQLKGKIIRIAHLGYVQPADVLVGITALEKALKELGAKVELGKGVQAAKKVLGG